MDLAVRDDLGPPSLTNPPKAQPDMASSTVFTITHGSESQASIIDEFEVADTTPQGGITALIAYLSGVASGARQGKIAVNVDGGAATATWKFGVS